ncbi:hypothetical protein Prum_063950 [Phytohabitans rumicis]|uniref:Uncharacterized protein n=1 Tax=Phytohabitans rumicis TaxID=1076125 RepID=A0A6V8L690_9ACTN|nr:hypothetical protein Prum_063950 [Phytohabitans rumicis]
MTAVPSVWHTIVTVAPSATVVHASYEVPGAARTVSAEPAVLTVPVAARAGPDVPRSTAVTAVAVTAVPRRNRLGASERMPAVSSPSIHDTYNA